MKLGDFRRNFGQFCCPHHNQHESHSLVSRSEHFDSLLRLSPGEVGLGVDNQACFVV